MSSSAFRALAADAMSSDDAAMLDYCTLDPDPVVAGENPDNAGIGAAYAEPAPATSSAFLNRWREWERALRLNLARGRSQKLKRDGGAVTNTPEYPISATAAAKTALAIESPLEAEIFLDKARWDAIENLQGLNTFSENAMYAYLLKLLLLERKVAFNAEEGFTEYKGLYAAILERAGDAAGVEYASEFESERTEPGEPK